MVNPDALRRHSAPNQHAGTIRFRGEWAYLENMSKSDWSLLQFDSPSLASSITLLPQRQLSGYRVPTTKATR